MKKRIEKEKRSCLMEDTKMKEKTNDEKMRRRRRRKRRICINRKNR